MPPVIQRKTNHITGTLKLPVCPFVALFEEKLDEALVRA